MRPAMPDTDTAPITWSDAFLLGYPPMDATHREFVDCVHALQTCEPAHFTARLEAFREHAVAHFAQEEQWMVETEFPPRDCHIDEHAAVMKSVEQVLELLRTDPSEANVAIGRRLAAELVRWFPGHADYLDSALSAWMSKRATGGKPVVVRRSIADSPAPPGF